MGMAFILVTFPRPFYREYVPFSEKKRHIKFGFDWPCDFKKEMFKNNGHMHVYSPGAGARHPPWGHFFLSFFFKTINLLLIWSIAPRYFSINYFRIVFPIQTYRRPNLTLTFNSSTSNKVHHVYKLCRT